MLDQMKERIAELEECFQEILADRVSAAYAEGYAKGRADGVHSGRQYGLMAAKQCYDACKLIDGLDPHNDSTTEWNVAFNMVREAVIAAENKEIEK